MLAFVVFEDLKCIFADSFGFQSFHWEISYYSGGVSFICDLCFFSLETFNTLSLLCILNVLIAIVYEEFFFSGPVCLVVYMLLDMYVMSFFNLWYAMYCWRYGLLHWLSLVYFYNSKVWFFHGIPCFLCVSLLCFYIIFISLGCFI